MTRQIKPRNRMYTGKTSNSVWQGLRLAMAVYPKCLIITQAAWPLL